MEMFIMLYIILIYRQLNIGWSCIPLDFEFLLNCVNNVASHLVRCPRTTELRSHNWFKCVTRWVAILPRPNIVGTRTRVLQLREPPWSHTESSQANFFTMLSIEEMMACSLRRSNGVNNEYIEEMRDNCKTSLNTEQSSEKKVRTPAATDQEIQTSILSSLMIRVGS